MMFKQENRKQRSSDITIPIPIHEITDTKMDNNKASVFLEMVFIKALT